jgi:broad-specificity NMP kinase
MPKTVLPLGTELEAAILNAILKGVVSLDVVTPAELSKIGRLVYAAIQTLVTDGYTAPYGYNAVLLAATEIHGGPRDAVRAFLVEVNNAGAGVEVRDIVRRVREKQLVYDLINEAGKQLQAGSVDLGLLGGLIAREASFGIDLQTAAERIKDGLPPPPQGLGFASLPKLREVTGGIIGVWAVAGEPGVGKSTLAWQLALDVGRRVPVLVYDFENGFAAAMDHTREIFGGNLERVQAALRQVYHRDSIRTLDSDLGRVPAPALIIVDSVQKLPASIENRRHGIDRWVHRLEYLKKRGYSIMMVSEVGRMYYDSDASLKAFKETGEIEYTADVGLQLLPTGGDSIVEVAIVKNRHRKFKGSVGYLERRNSWLFAEMGAEAQTGIRID